MNKGDKFVVEMVFVEALTGKTGWFNFVADDGGCGATMSEVERAAAAYAAKQQPAPVAPDWQPKVGERVLVEATVIDVADYQGDLLLRFPHSHGQKYVNRSAIIGPAPKQPRFKVGDEVFDKVTLSKQIISSLTSRSGLYNISMTMIEHLRNEDDLLTLAEALERLGRKP